ncbi:MAG: HAD-IIA family hydrolase [Planctomycetota bacterium]
MPKSERAPARGEPREEAAKASPSAALERLRAVRHLVLDLDGTVYLGSRVFPWSRPFFERLRALGVGRSFVTNNNSRSLADYLARLKPLVPDIAPRDIYTSTLATIDYLREAEPRPRRLYILGTPALRKELCAAGFVECGESPDDPPEAVVVGFDTSLAYPRLARAAYWIRRAARFVATHPDRVCPTDGEILLPDCGSIAACLAAATGREPDAVPGKPSARMVLGAIRGRDLPVEAVAVVGDRLYTDMAMARASGALAVLVLSGETTREEADANPGVADLVVQDLGELGDLLANARDVAPGP